MKNKYLIIALHFFINLILCIFLEPFHDEAYYLTFTNKLAFGYYDHPPFVAWMIYFGKLIFHDVFSMPLNLAIRFPFLMGQTLITYKLIEFFNIKNYWKFFLIISSYFVWQSSFIAIPDSLLIIFTVYYLVKIKEFIENSKSLKLVLILSTIVSFGLYAKYHFFLLLIFTFIAHPKLLTFKNTYLIIMLSLILFFPHVYWQYQNDFVTWKFHLFGRKNNIMGFENFSNLFLAYLGLGGFLISFLPFKLKIKDLLNEPFNRLLTFCFLGQITFFFLLCFRNQIEGNWLLTAIVPAIFLIFYNKLEVHPKILIFNFLVLFIIKISFLPPIIMNYIPRLAEVHEWPKIISIIKDTCLDKPIITNNYQFAAKSSFYLNKYIHALHLKGRTSQYSLNKFLINPDIKYCFISDFKIKGAKRYQSIHDGRIYIDTSFTKEKMNKIIISLNKEK